MQKKAINPDFLPASEANFNRAAEVTLGEYRLFFISGTASVGPKRQTMYPKNFKVQVEYTYSNISRILQDRSFEINDVIKWRIYLKDIEKYYAEFNVYRDEFFRRHSITRSETGASVCVEAKLCRSDLLVEIEAEALKYND